MSRKLLEAAVRGLVTRKHPGHTLVGDEAVAWLKGDGAGYGRISAKTGDRLQFDTSGVAAVSALARSLRQGSAVYKRGSSHPNFAKAVADYVMSTYGGDSPSAIDDDSVKNLEDHLGDWWKEVAVSRRHFVPCALLVDDAKDVSVGPVTFIHATHIFGHPIGIADDAPWTDLSREHLQQALATRSSAWVAVVDVEDCLPTRSIELADLTVDIAIAAIQMLLPLQEGQHMARVSARSFPAWTGSFSVADGNMSIGATKNLPAMGIPGQSFDAIIGSGQHILHAAGHCLSRFLTDSGPLVRLSQAWCDAAYWFHQGIGEPLDTIAIAKLETAIEVLMRSENSKGSAERMKQAIEATTGLGSEDLIALNATVTVRQFVKNMVGARSQILHGTFSTLKEEVTPTRSVLDNLVQMLLLDFCILIEKFSTFPESEDNIEALLSWNKAARTLQ